MRCGERGAKSAVVGMRGGIVRGGSSEVGVFVMNFVLSWLICAKRDGFLNYHLMSLLARCWM